MDPVSAARTARESLARGLAALQSPGLPPQLLQAAEPVAHAMSALHRIESSGGAAIVEAAPSALVSVRNALGYLQAQGVNHPAVDQALEAIAGSLSIVHQLTQRPAPVPPTQPAPQNAPSPGYAGGYGAPPAQAQPAAGFSQQQPPAPSAPYTQPSSQLPFTGRPDPQIPIVGPGAQAPVPQQSPYGAPPQQYAPASHGNPEHASTLASAVNPLAAAPVAPPPVNYAAQNNGLQRVEAALGAHSTTNFYKGLSGNDIIDSGGIFVATYQIPRIGTNLLIHVSLPGGYEFEAVGVVRWTRDTPQGSDAPPGFGAQFTQISPDGRQLVYRYVRNREPLFHDDL